MNFRKRNFRSKNVLLFALVLTGIAIGFGLAFVYFSGTGAVMSGNGVLAQDRSGSQGAAQSTRQAPVVPGAAGVLSFSDVAEALLPSVVQLNVTEMTERQTPEGNLPWFYYFFQQPDEQSPQPPQQTPQRGLGSGVIVRRERNTYYVLTNQHVAGGATEIEVSLYDNSVYDGTLVGSDPRRDLALVSFDSDEDIPIAELGDSDTLRVGDWVLAIGNPFGFSSTVTAGIVSALGRRGGPEGNISDFIQTDAAINQGNSGGALVNMNGEVIGINTWIATTTGTGIGLGFAIPINNAKRAISDFITQGEVVYGWLGVSISDVPQEAATQYGVTRNTGAFVHHIFRGSPADRGGIMPGDIVLQMNGQRITDSSQLTLLIGDLRAGDDAQFVINRAGRTINLNVEIARRESQQTIDQMQRNLWPGMTVVQLTDQLRTQFNVARNIQGVMVADVESRTPSDVAGLRPGDVITSINNQRVQNILEFYRQLNAANTEEIRFRFIRDSVELSVGIIKR